MKILVAGCSFAAELSDLLQQRISGSHIVNVAVPAAGNRFIADSVILSTIKQKFDVIYVSWSGLSRYDVPVNDVSYFNDWTAKAKLYETNYIFTSSIGSWDQHHHLFADELFGGYHKFVEQKELHYNSLLEIIKIKGYLKAIGVPFYFTTMINQFNANLPDAVLTRTSEISARSFPEHSYLIDNLDLDNWILKDSLGIFETMRCLGLVSQDGFHPNKEGYSYWMDLFVERLKEDKII